MPNLTFAQRWIILNTPYTRNNRYGLKKRGQIHFQARTGTMLLTASHSVRHYRSPELPDKVPDAYTGGLCDLLGEGINTSTLTAASFFDAWDTWSERDDAFKNALTAAVAKKMFVFDLHGMSDKHGIDMCLGLGSHPSGLSQQVALELQRALSPLNVTINQPFGARQPYTIASYAQSLGGDALQIEIARRLRDPYEDTEVAHYL